MFVTVRHIESIVVELALQLVPPAVALGKFHNMAKSFLKTPFIQERILILMLLRFHKILPTSILRITVIERMFLEYLRKMKI